MERQRELIEQWAASGGHEIVGWAEDRDVSGAVDPFKTPELGKWLTEPELLHSWDALVAWKVDRVARNAIYMSRLFAFIMENDKTFATVSDNIDLSTTNGRMLAGIIAGLAEGELEAIKERTQASRQKLQSVGRWPGGKPCYGYRAVENPEGPGWVLDRDPVSYPVLIRIIDDVIEGNTLTAICRKLDEEGVRAPSDHTRWRAGRPERGAKWSVPTVGQLLRSPALLGQIVYKGDVVRDEKGEPILAGPPLINWDTFQRLQAALDVRGHRWSGSLSRMDASPLLGVAKCWFCDAPVLHNRQIRRGKEYRYYHCKYRCCDGAKAETYESMVEEALLSEIGDRPMTEKVYIPAEDHQHELEEANAHADALSSLLATASSERRRKALMEQLSALDERIAALEKLPESKARWEYKPTGKTYGEVWKGLDLEGRRQLMLKAGIVARLAMVDRIQGSRSSGVPRFELVIPPDVMSPDELVGKMA
ncbi:recombinase family protein [Rhodococcus hoagii]|nr:recombinase family protein [Prescottella equi]